MAVPRSGGYVLTLLYINLKKTKQVCFLLAAILIGKNIAKVSRLRAEEKEEVLRRPNKKGGRVAPPRSGGYVLILLYTKLKKSGTSLLFISCNSYWKNIAKASRSRAEEKEEVLRRPNKKGDRVAVPRSGGYVLTLLYTKLKKSGTSLLFISCNSY